MIQQHQANEIAESLLQEASAESEKRMKKVAARNTVVDRIRTAIVTLLGLGFGWRAAESWPLLHSYEPLVAVLTALIVAVIFPARRQT